MVWRALPSLPQDDLRDNAGGNGDQHVVGAHLYPAMPARRGTEPVVAPVFDHVLPAAVVVGQTIAPVKASVRSRTPTPIHLLRWRAPGSRCGLPIIRSALRARLARGLLAISRRHTLSPRLLALSGLLLTRPVALLLRLGLRLGQAGAETEAQGRQGEDAPYVHGVGPFRNKGLKPGSGQRDSG